MLKTNKKYYEVVHKRGGTLIVNAEYGAVIELKDDSVGFVFGILLQFLLFNLLLGFDFSILN